MKRLWPAIQALRCQYPEDRWVFMTLTARADDEPLETCIRRFKGWFAKFRRLPIWKTTFRGAVASYEVTYRPGRGWHVHIHLLASRQVWVDQTALAHAWRFVTAGAGTVVDIRDRNASVRAGMSQALTYPFKPVNLAAWEPAQVAEFLALGRTKLAECYGALRGLAAELAADDEEGDDALAGHAPRRRLAAGAPCPACAAPLEAQWYTAEEVSWGRQLLPHRPQAPPAHSCAA